MTQLTWCVHCHRVWDVSTLKGSWPQVLCPDRSCNDGSPGSFMPYVQTRILIAPHWPEVPRPGQILNLGPQPELDSGRVQAIPT